MVFRSSRLSVGRKGLRNCQLQAVSGYERLISTGRNSFQEVGVEECDSSGCDYEKASVQLTELCL